jgi:hypothetical protein
MSDAPDNSSIFTLKSLVDEVRSIVASELYDPRALTRRCLQLFPVAVDLADKSVGFAHIYTVLELRRHAESGVISWEEVKKRAQGAQTAEFSADEIPWLANFDGWSILARHAAQVLRALLLSGAFVVSFVAERLFRGYALKAPAHSDSLASDFIGATLFFVFQLVFFADLGERIESYVNWKIFRRIHAKLLKDLEQLYELCQAHIAKAYDVLRGLPPGEDSNRATKA